MTSPLPERPNLEQLKRQAKELLRAARTGDPIARARFQALPAIAKLGEGDFARATFSLHDAQSVIAREHGFASWPDLRERVESLALEFGAAVTAFIEAATSGRTDRARRLLSLHPGVARANFHTALLTGDLARIEAALAADPQVATEPAGPRRWPALLYVCHATHPTDEARRNSADIARRLLALGADPNGRFPWLHHGVRRPVLWAACCIARDLPLARVLLDAGADPNDGVTLTLAAMGGDVDALELLHACGANVDAPWATDGATPLLAALSWATTSQGLLWLVDKGANANAVFPPTGEAPLHRAAARCGVEVTEALVARGAELDRRRVDGRTPYAVAEINGNRAVAAWLAEHGADTALPDVDRFVAACRQGDRETVAKLLARRSDWRGELTVQHYAAFHHAAETGDAFGLEALLAGGFDPNRPDEEIGKTVLHSAAQAGQAEAVRVLLRHGASVLVTDREFKATPLVWAADGARRDRDRDFTPIARALIAAGSSTEWQPANEPAEDVLEILDEWRSLPTSRTLP